MENKQQAINTLKKWKLFYILSFTLPILVFTIYVAYSVSYVPKPIDILLNNSGSVYTSEDLSVKSISEGQLKQLVFSTIKQTFSFNYLSYAEDSDYEAYLNGDISTDLPDHRDAIRPMFSNEFYPEMIMNLKSDPWIEKLYQERRKIKSIVITPPVSKRTVGDWILSSDDRLNAEYSGFFYVRSESENFKSFRFKVDYFMVMERKPDVVNVNMPTYFYQPMVKQNTNKWRVKYLNYTVGRKQ